jgi:hypothetical protein
MLGLTALLFGATSCGGGSTDGVDTNGQSVIVIRLAIQPGVPDLFQIHVHSHLGSGANNSDLVFPKTPSPTPIPSGATLGLLISPSIMDGVDLSLYGLDVQGTVVATGTKQVTQILVGGKITVEVPLALCGTTCN